MNKRRISVFVTCLLIILLVSTFALSGFAFAATSNYSAYENDTKITWGQYPDLDKINVFYRAYTDNINVYYEFSVQYNYNDNMLLATMSKDIFFENLKTCFVANGFSIKYSKNVGSNEFIARQSITMEEYNSLAGDEDDSVVEQKVYQGFLTYSVYITQNIDLSSFKQMVFFDYIDRYVNPEYFSFYAGMQIDGKVDQTNASFALEYLTGETFYFYKLDSNTFSNTIYLEQSAVNPSGVIIIIILISFAVVGIMSIIYVSYKKNNDSKKVESNTTSTKKNYNYPPYNIGAPNYPFGKEYENPINLNYFDNNGMPNYTNNQNNGYNPYIPNNRNNGYNPYIPNNQNNGYNPYNLNNQNNGYNPYNLNNQNNGYNPYNVNNQNNGYNPYYTNSRNDFSSSSDKPEKAETVREDTSSDEKNTVINDVKDENIKNSDPSIQGDQKTDD